MTMHNPPGMGEQASKFQLFSLLLNLVPVEVVVVLKWYSSTYFWYWDCTWAYVLNTKTNSYFGVKCGITTLLLLAYVTIGLELGSSFGQIIQIYQEESIFTSVKVLLPRAPQRKS